MTDLSERDYALALEYAKNVAASKHWDGLWLGLVARCYLSLQSKVEAGVLGLVPSGWQLIQVSFATDGQGDSWWWAELMELGSISESTAEGFGATPEAAVLSAASKVTG